MSEVALGVYQQAGQPDQLLPLAVDAIGQLVDGDTLAEIIDTTTSATYSYHCEAQPGTLTSAALWRISRLTVATGVVQWADGNANFDNIAANRATTQVYA
jgi:hypothetical protein